MLSKVGRNCYFLFFDCAKVIVCALSFLLLLLKLINEAGNPKVDEKKIIKKLTNKTNSTLLS